MSRGNFSAGTCGASISPNYKNVSSIQRGLYDNRVCCGGKYMPGKRGIPVFLHICFLTSECFTREGRRQAFTLGSEFTRMDAETHIEFWPTDSVWRRELCTEIARLTLVTVRSHAYAICLISLAMNTVLA